MNAKWIYLLMFVFLFAGCNTASTSSNDISTDTTMSNSVKTAGTLTVTTTTSTAGGNYAPRNIVAIWIKSGSGTYVKTLLSYAAAYKRYLTNWASNSGYNVTDATTGATRTSFGTYTVTWNGTYKDGTTLVGDGTYILCMELTDKDGTGNYHEFKFTKGVSAVTLTPSDVSSFSGISIAWKPK